MKILKHGIYYYDTVTIVCKKCNCKYEISKEDIKHYDKPKKVTLCAFEDCWTEKYHHYSNCPECNYDNEMEYRDYEILTTNVISKPKVDVEE